MTLPLKKKNDPINKIGKNHREGFHFYKPNISTVQLFPTLYLKRRLCLDHTFRLIIRPII